MRPTLPALLTLACLPSLVRPARAQCVEELLAAGAQAGDQFGTVVALLGDRAVVGAPWKQPHGAAYLFEASASGWVQVAELAAKDPSKTARFGYAVGIEEGRVFVGDPLAVVGGKIRGAVFVFEDGGAGWSQVARVSTGTGTGDGFGGSLAVDGDRLLVGAPWVDDGPVIDCGAAYVFEDVNGTWVEQQRLTRDKPQMMGQFGWSVDLDGEVAVVLVHSMKPEGEVWIFERSAGVWSEATTLSAAPDTGFGAAAAVSGDWALVGAPGDSTEAPDSGAVYAFQRTDQGWVERQKITRAASRKLGWTVAVDGALAVAGAPGEQQKPARAHVLEEIDGTWVERELWKHADADDYDWFAGSVDVSPGRAIAGAPGEDTGGDNAGAAYVLELDAGRSEVYCESSPNSTGRPCVLAASGSLGVSANDTVFHVSQGPPGAFGYLIYGSGQTRIPFGDGFLCIDPFHPGLFRLPPVLQLDANGAADRPLDLGALPPGGEIEALQEWSFQYWFRDPAAGGSGFNFSHGLSVSFCY